MEMQRFKGIRRAICFAMVAGLGWAGLATLPAQAAACTYNGCSGKDPQTTGCSSDARNLSTMNTDYGDYVELRYSPSCGAVWVRLTTIHCQWDRPQLETGYIDYYGTYHRQGLFTGTVRLCVDGTKTGWTPMSSYRRERLKYGSDYFPPQKVYLTGCNDCY
jgi:hypothetical protein